MKEVTGELNSTLVVAVSVGVLSAFFFGYIWPLIKGNFDRNSQCSKAICNCGEEATPNGLGPRVTIDGVEYCSCRVNDTELKCVYKG